MKKLSLTTITATLFLLVTSCQSTGVDHAAGAVGSLDKTRVQLGQMHGTIDSALASLNALADGSADMALQYGAFANFVGKLETQGKRLHQLRDDIAERQEKYIDGWGEQLRDLRSDELQKRAEERRNTVIANFDSLLLRLDTVTTNLDPWVVDMVDVMTYLEHDLNPGGVASLEDVIKRSNGSAGTIKSEVAGLMDELARVSKAIAVAPPPPSNTEARASLRASRDSRGPTRTRIPDKD